MLADFKITTHEGRKPMTVQIKVHDSVGALRNAANQFDRRRGKKMSDSSDFVGICHRFHMMNDDLIALVRLAPPHLGAAVLTHELAHAAVWMWEIQNKFQRDRKTMLQCSNDEWFCFVLGELVHYANDTLYKKGVYLS